MAASLTADQLNRFFCGVSGCMGLSKLAKTSEEIVGINLSNHGSLFLTPVSEVEILEIITEMKDKYTEDIYGWSTHQIKKISSEIVLPLRIVINKCFREGVFPDELKYSKIIPAHKTGDTEIEDNYRPLTINPIISKIFETALSKRIYAFLEKNKIFATSQHGYRKSFSTSSLLVEMVEKIATSMDQGKLTRLILYDLSRAFDLVPHGRLLSKLESCGVRGVPANLIASYLGNRKQSVYWGGHYSGVSSVNIGVPQGSVLGPLLFNVYVNDFSDIIDVCAVGQYADDTSLLIQAEDISEMNIVTVEVKEKVKNWFNTNNLIMNEEKTQIIDFRVNSSELSNVKFLGVLFDDNLKWISHVTLLAKKLNTALYSIRRIKFTSTRQIARVAYFSNFHSILSYGILLWGASPHANDIFIIQKQAVRVLAGLEYRESCREAFKTERILTLTCVYIVACLVYMHNNLDRFAKNGSNHAYNTRNKEHLQIPYHRLTITQNTVNYWGTKLYNKVPQGVKDSPNFREIIKATLCHHPFYSLEEFMEASIVWPGA